MALHSYYNEQNKLLFQLRFSTYIENGKEFKHELASSFPPSFLKHISGKAWDILNSQNENVIDTLQETELVKLVIDSIINTPISKLYYYEDWITSRFKHPELLKRLIIAQNTLNINPGDYFTKENNPMEFFNLRSEWFNLFFFNQLRFESRVKEIAIEEVHHEVIKASEVLRNAFVESYKTDNQYFKLVNNGGIKIVVVTDSFNMNPVLIFCH